MKFWDMNSKPYKSPVRPGAFSIKLNTLELREIEIAYGACRPVHSDLISSSVDAERIFRK